MLKTTVRSECLPGAPPSRHTLYMFRLVYIAAVVLWRTAVGGVDALVPSPHRAVDTTAASRNSSHNRSVAPRTGAVISLLTTAHHSLTIVTIRYHVDIM